MTAEPLPATASATGLSERALGPDLARGVMLLFIALANSHYFLLGERYVGGFPAGGSRVDDAVAWLVSTFVDGRAFPMFGLLFGYGVAHIVRRNAGFGSSVVDQILFRRSLVLIVIGVLDALLFYAGDILAMYGVLLFVGILLVRRSDAAVLAVAAVFFVLGALPSVDSLSISTAGPGPEALPPDLATMFSERAAIATIVALVGPIGFVCPFAIGLWAGRRRILERPAEHRVLLRIVAAVGISAAVLGAQPAALLVTGAYERPADDVLEWVGPLHDATGVLGGFGYAALICLVATRLRNRGLVAAVAAVGQRSMTCYLLQSPVWFVAFTPFLLDLADTLTVTTTALLAIGVWAASVGLAEWMRRTGRRGPFETLTRRFTYAVRPVSAAPGDSAPGSSAPGSSAPGSAL
ncbi:putative membrane protein YeiB [Promicromonospora sp. AC04]|uniref:DUF418 domain-containing protein n=1 Tax=Promicromonospora sp. AC04 TaxID=2135723 RepID=UPI000D3A12AC|nr:DUF418 domain-containing protein [Promicromonospora sp. AC04]PUB26274.1 putative membrane protein YeiB [Promicromonospora sp. AC04]